MDHLSCAEHRRTQWPAPLKSTTAPKQRCPAPAPVLHKRVKWQCSFYDVLRCQDLTCDALSSLFCHATYSSVFRRPQMSQMSIARNSNAGIRDNCAFAAVRKLHCQGFLVRNVQTGPNPTKQVPANGFSQVSATRPSYGDCMNTTLHFQAGKARKVQTLHVTAK